MAYRSQAHERLLNLVIALVNTSASMTKQQIRSKVNGYAHAPTVEAFERMFERDKDALRELGVPVMTVDSGGHADDVGYRIDLDAYALRELDLTPAELGVLSLAAQFWADKNVRADISRALTKIRSAGVAEAAGDVVAGLAPRVRAVGEAYGPLLDAIGSRTAVTFTYRAASTGEVLSRVVEPWRIAARGGGWYLLGFDRERGAARAYRLSRVVGRVRAIGTAGAYALPDDVDVDALLGTRGGEPRTARLAVLAERAGALRARGTAVAPAAEPTVAEHTVAEPTVAGSESARDVVDVPFTSTTSLADEIAGYADAVLVLAPQDLRDAVVERLRLAAALGRTEAHDDDHAHDDDDRGSRG
ncbi:transcriptional regulator [Sediminihabitans luteus]|uniref:Transcriptional regulator n=1 Tax=Sediminihabitans luteus TaxID=1138585 RepID=A0A2M9CR03_9CELL|nr:WYL domain-containing protein [Sediminihabitans luteus]PJJ74265.1 transcriptional regulator [Sediminihabitans luteus]GII99118.1 protein PafB [Sediminihabitans luteus]